jgi:hypothetical protein
MTSDIEMPGIIENCYGQDGIAKCGPLLPVVSPHISTLNPGLEWVAFLLLI